jgi:hypothetical protein
MEDINYIRNNAFVEVYPQRGTVIDKSAATDDDFTIYEKPYDYDYWVDGAGKDAAWLFNFKFQEGDPFVLTPFLNGHTIDHTVDVVFGDTILLDKTITYLDGIYSLDFSPIPDPEDEGNGFSQFELLRELLDTELPIYIQPHATVLQRQLIPAGDAKMRIIDTDFENPNQVKQITYFGGESYIDVPTEAEEGALWYNANGYLYEYDSTYEKTWGNPPQTTHWRLIEWDKMSYYVYGDKQYIVNKWGELVYHSSSTLNSLIEVNY